jgi:DNA repair ATPase RecN
MEYRQIRNKIKYVVDLIENKTSNIIFYFKMNIDELDLMRERYLKLVDIHGQLQVQNSLLEERILSIVETYSTEKSQLEQALSDAKEQIVYLQETVNELQTEKQRYKDDCNLAVRLLHRYPNEFISTTSGQIPEQLKNRYEVV